MKKDKALWFFGLAALACLGVSIPATAKAMQLFHGYEGGIAAMLVFEIGAVGSELATLAIPQWRKRLLLLTVTLLILTTGGNYALGVDHFSGAQLDGTYATIRAAGAGWLLAIMSSAIFPALLFVFLTAFTARFRMVRGGYATPAGALAFWMAVHWQGAWRELEQLRDWSREALQIKDAEIVTARNDLEQRATLLQQTEMIVEQSSNDYTTLLHEQQRLASELEQVRAQRETALQEHHQLKEWIRTTLQTRDMEITDLRTALQSSNGEIEILQRKQLSDTADTLIVAGSAVGCNALAREIKVPASRISRAVKKLTQPSATTPFILEQEA